MRTRKLRHSDLDITTVGFGAWAIGGGDWAFGWGAQDDSQSVAAILRALELGINWIDTAAIYGLGHSEDIVAQALAEYGNRDEVIVATKCGLCWRDNRSVYGSLKADSVRREVEASLRRLKVEAIDLYQIHAPNPDIPIVETMAAMRELVSDGRVRHVGVSNFSVPQMQEAQDALGDIPLASNQVRYSLAVRTIEDDVLPYCQNNDITIIAYSPLVRKGDFSASGLEDARAIAGLEGSCDDLAQRLEKVAAEIGKTPAQVLLNWVVSQPQVITIPKTDRVERVDEAVGALGWTLDPAQRAALTGS